MPKVSWNIGLDLQGVPRKRLEAMLHVPWPPHGPVSRSPGIVAEGDCHCLCQVDPGE